MATAPLRAAPLGGGSLPSQGEYGGSSSFAEWLSSLSRGVLVAAAPLLDGSFPSQGECEMAAAPLRVGSLPSQVECFFIEGFMKHRKMEMRISGGKGQYWGYSAA